MNRKAILFIEDNFHTRRIVRKVLSAKGYDVIEAENGVKGYEMICDLRPPLVLLDIALPGIDGIEILKRVKADTTLQNIPVIAVTASAMQGDRERFIEAGCNEYLPKPFNTLELVDMVDGFIG
jgi:CheY-like chemotaxis protein